MPNEKILRKTFWIIAVPTLLNVKVPFKTVLKAMKHVGKEPFNIFVDPKPDSEAAKVKTH